MEEETLKKRRSKRTKGIRRGRPWALGNKRRLGRIKSRRKTRYKEKRRKIKKGGG